MDREACICAVKCFGSVAIDYLPDILEPFSKYGRALGSLVRMVKDGTIAVKNGLSALESQRQQEFEKTKQEAYEELKNICNDSKTPMFADVVVFSCKSGVALSQEQRERLKAVLLQEYESDDSRSLLIISEFLKQYMGETIDVDSEDDCEIGDTYINFTFNPYEEHPYDKENMDLVMEALNNFLGAEVFDYYLVDGHDER